MTPLQESLLALPDRVGRLNLAQLPNDLSEHLTTSSVTMLQMYQGKAAKSEYEPQVVAFLGDPPPGELASFCPLTNESTMPPAAVSPSCQVK